VFRSVTPERGLNSGFCQCGLGRKSSFGIDSLEVVERLTPVPGPEEVLIQGYAVSFNYRDSLWIKGHYNPKLTLSAN
jgi:hypothetical protein